MCGITGYVDFDGKTPPSTINGMAACITHRGPDSGGKFVSNKSCVSLGIRRLSIIDLKTGDQPIYNEDKTIVIIYNGEIYNYKNLKDKLEKSGHRFRTQSDTEVIVHGYEQWGVEIVSKLNGMFAFALWDEKRQKLFVGRDRSGIKPLYYAKIGNKLIFGSELKTILKFPDLDRSIDNNSINEYLYIGFVSNDRSVYKNIKKLQPGNYLVFQKSGLTIRKYFNLEIFQADGDLDELLDRVVQDQLVSDVPVGVFLSGGLDSSLISYYISKHKKLNSFSIGFAEAGYDESKHAHYVAKIIGTKHHSEEFISKDVVDIYGKVSKLLDEPISDPSLIPTYKVCRLARKHVKVVLSGDGGDELFGGYPTYQAQILAGYFDRLPKFFADLANGLVDFVPSKLYDFLPLSFKDYPKKRLAQIVLKGLKYNNPKRQLYWMKTFFLGDENLSTVKTLNTKYSSKISSISSKFVGQFVDFETYLSEDFLVKVDRASSFNSLEVRVPYLDNRIINYAFSSKRNHLNLLKTKIEMRKLLKENLPQISKRPKKGFGIPLQSWLKNDLKDFAYDYLKEVKLYEYVSKKKIECLWKEHQKGQNNHSGAIWQLIVLSGWLQNWT